MHKKKNRFKEDKKINKTEQFVKLISEAASLFGWQIAFNNTTKKVAYVILAEPKEINKLIGKLEK